MTCPFKVGDRIHGVRTQGVNVAGPMVLDGLWQLLDPASFELDSATPDATVTALTARGFTYRYDHPIQFVRPDWGTMQEGEIFEGGFQFWRKVN